MYLDRLRLDGRVAFVTGGAQGIGRACGDALAEAGATVVTGDVKGGDVTLDITDPAAVDAAAADLVARHGRVDILINNAGIARSDTPAEDVTDEHWRNVIDVNLNGAFWCARAFGRHKLAGTAAFFGEAELGEWSGALENELRAAPEFWAQTLGLALGEIDKILRLDTAKI